MSGPVDRYHAGKLLDISKSALRAMTETDMTLTGRLLEGLCRMPLAQRYWRFYEAPLEFPTSLKSYGVCPRLLREPGSDDRIRLNDLHWHFKRKLKTEVLDWYFGAFSSAYRI
ncbi:MAG: hypothetical protein MRY64_10565 [Hyphomonadaceae bacterium]|nr:hypothetical protein [Hyphomonadaceae bacterium]